MIERAIVVLALLGLLAAHLVLDHQLAQTRRALRELHARPAPTSTVTIDWSPLAAVRVELGELRLRTEYLRTIVQLVVDRVEWGARAALPKPLFDWSPLEIRTEASYREALKETR